jgi:phosphoglycolate phosphatase-like HAD superfamily hydrolase
MNPLQDAMKIESYDFTIFDSDGVVLDSNDIKLEAFCTLAEIATGKNMSSSVRSFVNSNKGLTRYEIVKFIDELATTISPGRALCFEDLLKLFSDIAYKDLLRCRVAEDLPLLRVRQSRCKWIVVTAGDQEETRALYYDRGISNLFDGGVFGSPHSKQTNITLLKSQHGALGSSRVLLIGDSHTDAELALNNGFDFVLLTSWSRCQLASSYCREYNLPIRKDIPDLLRRGLT